MRLQKRVWIGAGFSFILVLITGSLNCPKLWRLYRQGVSSQGWITGLDRSNHNTVSYSFVVRTRTYAGSQQGFSGLAGASLGNSLRITYLPQDPSISLADEPSERLENEAITVVLVGTVFPILMIIGLGSKKWARPQRT